MHHVLPISVLATILMWPAGGLVPSTGLDPGWVTALGMARSGGLHFGADLVFNYGPLGFALFPSAVDRQSLLVGMLLIGGLCSSYGVLTFRLVRTHIDGALPAAALAVALILLGPSTGAALCEVVTIALMATMIQLTLRAAPPAVGWYPAFGAFAGLLLVTKFSTGLVALAGALLFSVGRAPRVRSLSWTAAAFVVAAIAVWLALGQRLGDLWRWLRGSAQISSGHSWAMGVEEGGRRWELWFAAAVGLALAVGAGWVVWRRWSARRSWPVLSGAEVVAGALGAVVLWFAFKEGFVRHDIHSGVFFFAVMYLLATLTPWSAAGPWRTTLAVGWGVSVLALVASGGNTLSTSFDAGPQATAFFHEANALLDAQAWRDEVQSATAQMQQAYAVPDDVLAVLAGHRVQVDPYDPGPAWAYGLDWDPLPIFTRYSAYTPALDRADADRLRASDGPDLVLRSSPPPLDGHLALLEAPQTSMALLCDFTQVAASGGWQVLARADTAVAAWRSSRRSR